MLGNNIGFLGPPIGTVLEERAGISGDFEREAE
jgi:hypothetical protein